jgi:hypothetical protein
MILAGQRGHPVYWDGEEHWRYEDNDQPMTEDRDCYHCKQSPTEEGYDPCLGTIPDATAACCGHGMDEGYIMYGPNDIIKLYPIT